MTYSVRFGIRNMGRPNRRGVSTPEHGDYPYSWLSVNSVCSVTRAGLYSAPTAQP